MAEEKSNSLAPQEQVSLNPAPDTLSLISQADAVAARIEAANKQAAELLQRQEAILARNLLSGRAEAGQAAPQISEADKIKTDTKAYFKGTSIENVIK